MNWQTGQQAIADRLNMDNYDSADKVHPSLLAFPMSSDQEQKMHNEITVTSRLLPYDVHNQDYKQFPGGKNIYEIYKSNLQLDQIHFGEDLRASENMEYMSQGSVNNSLCFAGPHRKFDGVTGAYTKFVPGLGHCKSRVLNFSKCPFTADVCTLTLLPIRILRFWSYTQGVRMRDQEMRAGAVARPSR